MCTRSKDSSANFLMLTSKDGFCALTFILSLILIPLVVLVIRYTLIFQVIFAWFEHFWLLYIPPTEK